MNAPRLQPVSLTPEFCIILAVLAIVAFLCGYYGNLEALS